MPVPAWNPILDNEIDPESPITASLMQRLRDNICAVLGIDPTSPTQPTPPQVPSQLALQSAARLSASNTATTSEFVAFHLSDAMELSDLPGQFGFSGEWYGGPVDSRWDLYPLVLVYTSGSPSGVILSAWNITSDGSSYSGPFGVNGYHQETYPLDNAWHDVAHIFLSSRDAYVQVKFRATGTDIYCQFRTQYDYTGLYSETGFINTKQTRLAYAAKG